ncbi:MAG: tRNA pseudouridine(38-40) synthase TruA [Bacteroidales bacterium]|nr:tRNA pseudouridine(38-40) synthase TruA [Bacteroidales bacterium]
MRYFIYLQYDGTDYHGWQNQPDAVSVQEVIEKKLSMLMRRELFIVGAGRTDAGVHARLMVAHFELADDLAVPANLANADGKLDCEQLTFKLNGVLPLDISIIKVVPVREDAHARFSPTSRLYRYYVTTRKSPFDRNYAYRIFWEPDVELMNEAAKKLFDYIDFTSFSKLHTDVKTNNCRIMEAHWDKHGDEIVFTIKADRFLRNMVRAIVGTLLLVGRHKLTVEQFCRIIEGKDRCIAGDSAPARALFLEEVEYPEELFL